MTDRSPSTSSPLVPLAILVLVTLCCLVPFCNRAFNIDEPLFIWVAKQIQLHPANFYGFDINWYGTQASASTIIKNPPFASYYLALAAAVAGWSEIALHLAFLLPALGVSLGTYFLAREFTRNPLSAAVLAVVNPVFILSSASVMCDTMMLAFYVWAVYLWVRGIKGDRPLFLLAASFLVALCALTKYFGVSLIPLLFLYTMLSGAGKRKWALFLLVPAALLVLYQWQTTLLYGRGLLSDAASYATEHKGINLATLAGNLATGLSFTGGCLLTVGFLAGSCWNRRVLAAAALAVPLVALLLNWTGFPALGQHASPGYCLQLSLFLAVGAGLFWMLADDLRRHRDADALLLALWVLGTFLFASVLNWSVNGRSILPMAPAAAIVVLRFLERRHAVQWQPEPKRLALPLGLAFLVSMTIAWADCSLAGTARSAAQGITREYSTRDNPIWFQGHWGFQYYMELNGARAYDRKRSTLQPGDLMVVPGNNTNAFQDIYDRGEPEKIVTLRPLGFLSTMNYGAGAGFYSSIFGALPFRVGGDLEEKYHIIRFRSSIAP